MPKQLPIDPGQTYSADKVRFTDIPVHAYKGDLEAYEAEDVLLALIDHPWYNFALLTNLQCSATEVAQALYVPFIPPALVTDPAGDGFRRDSFCAAWERTQLLQELVVAGSRSHSSVSPQQQQPALPPAEGRRNQCLRELSLAHEEREYRASMVDSAREIYTERDRSYKVAASDAQLALSSSAGLMSERPHDDAQLSKARMAAELL